MPVFLFDKIIFGPVKSRRLGVSLGINLLPLESKYCNFDCIYCECGRTFKSDFDKKGFHSREEVRESLDKKLDEMKAANYPPNMITFAGNGEPTMHKDFAEIINDTIELRNIYFPDAGIAVLSNATLIHQQKVYDALLKVDENILKLDSAFDKTIKLLNNPPSNFTVEKLVENLKKFNGNLVIQTMFLRGMFQNQTVDNTTDEEVDEWINLLKEIKPRKVMVYTIQRDTPSPDLEKVSVEDLEKIAVKARNFGFNVVVSG